MFSGHHEHLQRFCAGLLHGTNGSTTAWFSGESLRVVVTRPFPLYPEFQLLFGKIGGGCGCEGVLQLTESIVGRV
jgi:hypothetical protein